MSLFKRNRRTPPAPQTASLRWSERAPRVPLLPLHRVEFRARDGMAASALRLANISTSGMGLLRDSGDGWPDVGAVISGDLAFEETIHAVSARIVHRSERVVGTAFVAPTPALRALVNRYFQVELEAVSMVETPPDMLQAEADGTPRWLHGANNCELFFVTRVDEIARFQITIFGTFIEWLGGDNPPRVGEVVEDESATKVRYKGSALVGRLRGSRDELLKIAERFVLGILHLSEAQKAFIAERLRRR
jgi:hypothetical protein